MSYAEEKSPSRGGTECAAGSPVSHGTFTLEQVYDVPPERVFTAWADPAVKSRWFAESEGFTEVTHSLEFRVGGAERCMGRRLGGRRFSNAAHYHDIVPDHLLVFSYRMDIDEKPVSVSLVTVELRSHPRGTELVLTEAGAFLEDGYTAEQRRSGWKWLLGQLRQELHQ